MSRDLRSRNAVEFLGLGLVAWLSALSYLVARTRIRVSLDLALVDTVHVYVGLASLVFFIAALAGMASAHASGVVPKWHWLNVAALLVYALLFWSGVLLLLPVPSSLHPWLVNAHLLSAVWAVPPTSWYVWRSRRELWQPLVVQWNRVPVRTSVAAVIVFLPLIVLGFAARALSPLSQSGTGGEWKLDALDSVFLDRLVMAPDGRTLMAGGDGLFVGGNGQPSWEKLPFPPMLVLGLAVTSDPRTAYVGTTNGLYAASSVTGPYRKLPLPAREVHGIAIDPQDPTTIWASSRSGFWRSVDGGQSWVNKSAGLRAADEAWALGYFGADLFGSDALGTYHWDGARWRSSSDQKFVVSLDRSADGRRLFASSMGEGLRVFDGYQWDEIGEGLASHSGGAIHVVGITSTAERAYAATMLDGVGVSRDGGHTWTALGAGLPQGAVWAVLDLGGGHLVAATDSGLFRYDLKVTPPSPGWWGFFLVALVAGCSLSLGLPRMAGTIWQKERDRPLPLRATRPS